jgi:hypothetical protein
MRLVVLGGLMLLAGCGGGTTGHNYSEPPPRATIVATPTPMASPSATATPEPQAVEEDANAAEAE